MKPAAIILREWKPRAVAAMRSGDMETLSRLNEEKAQAKKRLKPRCQWPGCDVPLKRPQPPRNPSRYCVMHFHAKRSGRKPQLKTSAA